jgi:hypothetical protein
VTCTEPPGTAAVARVAARAAVLALAACWALAASASAPAAAAHCALRAGERLGAHTAEVAILRRTRRKPDPGRFVAFRENVADGASIVVRTVVFASISRSHHRTTAP